MTSHGLFDKSVLLVDCGSSYFAQLHDAICSLVAAVTVVSVDELDVLEGLGLFDAVIISGSPKQFVEIDAAYYVNKASCVLDAAIPVLGICFGHQLLGLCFGAKVFQERKRTGDELIVLRRQHSLFEGLGDSFVHGGSKTARGWKRRRFPKSR